MARFRLNETLLLTLVVLLYPSLCFFFCIVVKFCNSLLYTQRWKINKYINTINSQILVDCEIRTTKSWFFNVLCICKFDNHKNAGREVELNLMHKTQEWIWKYQFRRQVRSKTDECYTMSSSKPFKFSRLLFRQKHLTDLKCSTLFCGYCLTSFSKESVFNAHDNGSWECESIMTFYIIDLEELKTNGIIIFNIICCFHQK